MSEKTRTEIKEDVKFLLQSYPPIIDTPIHETLDRLSLSCSREHECITDLHPMSLQCTLFQFGAQSDSNKLQAEELIHLLIGHKGRKYILENQTPDCKNILHMAIKYQSSLDLIAEIINVGGSEILNKKYTGVLFYACSINAKFDVISMLIDLCDEEYIHEINSIGNLLHNAIDIIHGFGGRFRISQMIDTRVLEKLYEIGGDRLLTDKSDDDGYTPLHLACAQNAPLPIIDTLISLGGKKLMLIRTNEYFGFQDDSDDDDSDYACDIETKPHLTALHVAIKKNASYELISRLVDVGGKELVMRVDNQGYTALHYACMLDTLCPHMRKTSIDVVKKLLDIGGKELVMMKSVRNGERIGKVTALHIALEQKKSYPSYEVTKELLSIGGKQLAYSTDRRNFTALHYLSSYDSQGDNDNFDRIYESLISVGGKDLVYQKCDLGLNALRLSICNKMNMMPQLIDTGGSKLVLQRDIKGNNCFHYATFYWRRLHTSLYHVMHLFDTLVEQGGADIFTTKNSKGETPVYRCIRSYSYMIDEQDPWDVFSSDEESSDSDSDSSDHDDSYSDEESSQVSSSSSISSSKSNTDQSSDDLDGASQEKQFNQTRRSVHESMFLWLVTKGIEYGIGGKYGVGGIFDYELTVSNNYKSKVWVHWNDFIASVLQSDPIASNQPILHGAIHCEAPLRILKSIIHQFPSSVTKRDTDNILPLQLAIKNGMEWRAGMKLILKATAEAQRRLLINVAAENGLEWSDGIERVVAMNHFVVGIEDERDIETGFYPYMLAASCEGSNLNTIYELVRRNPQLGIII